MSQALGLSICPNKDNSWILNTEATHYITHDSSNLGNATSYPRNAEVLTGNGDSLPIAHTSNTVIPFHNKHFMLSHVLHTLHISSILIYVH